MKKAWRTNWRGTVSILAATTRGKAIARTLAAIDEAGHVRGSDNRKEIWKQIRATRAPEFDEWAEVDCSNSLWFAEELPPNRQKAGVA